MIITAEQIKKNYNYAHANSKLVIFVIELEKEFDLSISDLIQLFSKLIIEFAKDFEE